MKDFGKKLSFGLGVVNSGMRNTVVEPELVVVSTSGSFRITAPVSKVLGLASGDYVMFITNANAIDGAIAVKAPELVAFCEEAGLEFGSEEAYNAIHTEFDMWGIAKGIQEVDRAGNPIMIRERIGSAVRRKYVEAHYEELYSNAANSENEEIKAAVTREGITEEEIKDALAKMIQGDESPKYKGSKTANASGLTGVGTTLNFTDTNIWNQLKKDLGDEAESLNKIYSVDITNLQDVEVNNGKEVVTVKCAILTDSRTEKPLRSSEK